MSEAAPHRWAALYPELGTGEVFPGIQGVSGRFDIRVGPPAPADTAGSAQLASYREMSRDEG